MNIDIIRNYCLQRPHTEESLPFGPDVLVLKVAGKIFCLIALNTATLQINLKCEVALAAELRAMYPSVLPGYHMNKANWNTIIIDGSISIQTIYEWIDHSYHEVIKKLPKKQRMELFPHFTM